MPVFYKARFTCNIANKWLLTIVSTLHMLEIANAI